MWKASSQRDTTTNVVPRLHTEVINLGRGSTANPTNRPDKFVPVKIAVYDEKASAKLKQAQLSESKGSLSQDSSVYQWPHRPEMMYSVFHLKVSEITNTLAGEDGEPGETVNITNSTAPVIGVGDGYSLSYKTLLPINTIP